MLTKKTLQEFLLLSLGTSLVSIGVYFFKFPNHFSMGGVSGLSILLGELFSAKQAENRRARSAKLRILEKL